MTLSDIAEGLEVTTAQRERGVATVDRTDAPLAERLAPVADALPCEPAAAATVLETYAAGASVGEAARAADLAPITGAKTLHRCGERVDPLSPTGRDVLEDWLAGACSRTEAIELTGASAREFALATYVATHEPLPAARAALEGALTDAGATDGTDRLGDAVETSDELR